MGVEVRGCLAEHLGRDVGPGLTRGQLRANPVGLGGRRLGVRRIWMPALFTWAKSISLTLPTAAPAVPAAASAASPMAAAPMAVVARWVMCRVNMIPIPSRVPVMTYSASEPHLEGVSTNS